MKKIFVILLILVAVPLYVWDTQLLLRGFLDKKKYAARTANVPVAMGNTLQQGFSVHFIVKGKSPLLPYKEVPRPVNKKAEAAKKTGPVPSAPVSPPPITINGIMWNESNPVAMISLSDGSSTVVKNGQTISGGIVIKAIEKDQVEVEYKGALFKLKK
jgi:type IV pilus biogenesis protein PilP